MGCQQSLPTDVSSSFDFDTSKTSVRPGSERAKGFIDQIAETKAFENRNQPTTVSPAASAASGLTLRTVYSSSTVSLEVDEDVSYLLPKVDYNGHLMMEEIVRRTSSSIESSALSVGNGTKTFELQYAYRSQRGYNPQEPLKPNQEKHDITLNFASEDGGLMIGVYCGHGRKGKQCANFCHSMLPRQLAKFVRQKRVQKYSKQLKAEGNMKDGAWNPNMWPILSASEYEECCKRAFLETKKTLQQEKEIKDNLSGTSALTVCFHGGRMYVSSVGGCGAILGRRDRTGSYGEEEKCEIDDRGSHSIVEEARRIAISLAADHTPYCQEELERIQLAGAEVKDSDQIEYTNVICDSNDRNKKSKRIFMAGKSFPGTRFTRSICDSTLEEIGIVSDPNVVSCDLTANDDILVIASNGVFEFLTNQEIINICSECHDPLQASEAVTKAAYAKWIEHTNCCDDITVIVCFLSNLTQPSQRARMLSDVNAMVDNYELE